MAFSDQKEDCGPVTCDMRKTTICKKSTPFAKDNDLVQLLAQIF